MRDAARWGLWATGAGAALVWTLSVPALFTLPKLLVLAIGIAVSALALAFAKETAAGPRELLAPLAALFIALAISTALSSDPPLSLIGRYDNWAHGLWALSLYASVVWLSTSAFTGAVPSTMTALAWLGAVLGADALLQRAGLDPFIHKEALPLGRAVGTLGSPIDLGGALALLLPCALWTARRRGALGWACTALVAGGLWATGSRGAWLSAACGAVAFWRLSGSVLPERLPTSIKRAAPWIMALLIVAGLAAGLQPRRDAARWEVWKVAGHAFAERPWLGGGPDTFEQTFRRLRGEGFIRAMHSTQALQAYAHNDVLQALATVGLIGTAAYLWLLAAFSFQARRALGSDATGAAAAAVSGLLALFVVLKFNPVSLEVFVLAALAAGATLALAPRPEQKTASRAEWVAIAALGLASLIVCLRLVAADRSEASARALAKTGDWRASIDAHRRALSWSPCELSYGITLLNDLGQAINAAQDAPRRLELLAYGAEEGRRAVNCHPNEVNAHYIQGFAEFYQAELGLPDHLPLAERAIDEALKLDPMFEPLLRYRLQLAKKRGSAAKIAELESRLAELTKLYGL